MVGVLLLLAGWAVADSLNGEIRSADGKPVADAIVFFDYVSSGPFSPPERHPTITQRDRIFVPHVLPIVVGTTVDFLNEDPELHSVHAGGGPADFNFSFPRAGLLRSQTFEELGMVTLLCDIHHQMSAYVMVLQNPFFARTDEKGRYVIAELPAGTHTLKVWHESHAAAAREVTAEMDKVAHFVLTPRSMLSGGNDQGVRASSGACPLEVWEWKQVMAKIEESLQASEKAAESGQAETAVRLASDAYFACFEAHGMETAIRQNISVSRVFELEELFGELRNAARKTAKNGADTPEMGSLRAELLEELQKDAEKLAALGVRDEAWDRDGVVSGKEGAGHVNEGPAKGMPAEAAQLPASPSTATKMDTEIFGEVIARVRAGLAEAVAEAAAGQVSRAEERIGELYFDQFHRVEPALAARWPGRTAELERSFTMLRGRILHGDGREELASLAGGIVRDMEGLRAQAKKDGAHPWMLFFSSFFIIFREGFEAILVFAALLLYLERAGGRRAMRSVITGGVAAMAASVATAILMSLTVKNAGQSQEVLEGITLLVASCVLFYVSCWFIGKTQAGRWHLYLRQQIDNSLSRGSSFTLGLAAFLAVYREGAETVLFYRALAATAGGGSGILWAGFLAGAGGLAIVYLLFGKAVRRLPLGHFFGFTSALLFALAVVFAGQGIAELQAAGIVSLTLVDRMPSLPALGLYPTWETLLAQGLVVAVAAVAAMLVMRRRPAAAAVSSTP